MKKILAAGALVAALLAFPATALAYPGGLGCSGAGSYGTCPQHTMGAHCAVAHPTAFAQPLMGGILRSTVHAHGHFHECPALENDTCPYPDGVCNGAAPDCPSHGSCYGADTQNTGRGGHHGSGHGHVCQR